MRACRKDTINCVALDSHVQLTVYQESISKFEKIVSQMTRDEDDISLALLTLTGLTVHGLMRRAIHEADGKFDGFRDKHPEMYEAFANMPDSNLALHVKWYDYLLEHYT